MGEMFPPCFSTWPLHKHSDECVKICRQLLQAASQPPVNALQGLRQEAGLLFTLDTLYSSVAWPLRTVFPVVQIADRHFVSLFQKGTHVKNLIAKMDNKGVTSHH